MAGQGSVLVAGKQYSGADAEVEVNVRSSALNGHRLVSPSNLPERDGFRCALPIALWSGNDLNNYPETRPVRIRMAQPARG